MYDPMQTVDEPDREATASLAAQSTPQFIGRYRVERVLGQGGFGSVFLAHDDQLQRLVAIKVPHHHLVSRPEDAELYLIEARIVANLEHPNIVPVFDVGNNKDYPVFIVSKYIEGTTLASRMKENRPSLLDTVKLVAVVAETLHYAHCQALVHRDIKPGNILLDSSSKPYVTDFGLALREQDVGQGPRYAGTPAYMSPEQARGEGHRVDGRSDVFSLGVVLYELLTGRRPFKADSKVELLDQIASTEARPPRQLDESVPKELDRICLKALSNRASERYSTAEDMAEDLHHFLVNVSAEEMPTTRSRPRSEMDSGLPLHTPYTSRMTDNHPVRIVPKGLRSFDAEDGGFFVELLPGPRDRDGLPDSIRFWKTKIEEQDPDKTFAVGVLYGPSGCGKSSLVKAGLLPRLSRDVTAVYLEATPADTEMRLQNSLRKRSPSVPSGVGLKETLAALRRGQGVPRGKKVLIVLDQFEQWLHANRGEPNTELVQALRQCDGEHVQCILMVRDDFWMATTRLMRQLEIRLVEGQNSAAADLFDVEHARKVLAAIGRAFGKLPENPRDASKEQKQFLTQAIAGLAQEGKVVCVRLAVFAEMMKGKPWSPACLKAVGGAAGLGVTFLEETFSAATAPPEHRYHQKAARAVLTALLPEPGTDIKAYMKSSAQLLEASGYKPSDSKDFEDLLHLLDHELRLITPTDPEGTDDDATLTNDRDLASVPSAGPPPSSLRYYQLTHDYLVHSLRDWLTRKQKETWRGRAELLLADRAAVWNARPEHRQLPSRLQWLSIRLLTRPQDWTPPQRKMMKAAGRYHGVRVLMLAFLLFLIGWGGYEGYGRLKAEALRDQLLKADTKNVPSIVEEMAPYRRWIDPLLRDVYQAARAGKETDSLTQLHVSMALLPVDPSQTDTLYGRLLDATPQEVSVLCDVLAPYRSELREELWTAVQHPASVKERLRAACALAQYDPENERWATVAEPVVEDFVSVPPTYLERWLDCLRPVKGKLQGALEVVFRDAGSSETKRSLATSILADYLVDQPHDLADLLLDADATQFPVLYGQLKKHQEYGITLLQAEIDKRFADAADETARERLAKRQANAAAALVRMGRPAPVWPLLKHREDPRVRSYLVHRLGPLGVGASTIIPQLHEESDVTIRRALILSLGEIRPETWPPDERQSFLAELQGLYRTASDPGLHASAAWLLRQWQQEKWLQQVDQEWAQDRVQRQKRIQEILADLAREKNRAPPQWYVTSQQQTMVVMPGPVEFLMGRHEPGGWGSQHRQRIGRSFAISATAVTQAQYRRKTQCTADNQDSHRNYPAVYPSWFDAARYCNWLSEQEGIDRDQWCYEITPKDVKLRPNYLSRTGYRLPTEAEMEYANRAGAITKRFYGESEELLGKYGWYVPNAQGRNWPVGLLKPNDFGFFDTHGNVWCWCQEPQRSYPQGEAGKVFEDQEGALEVNPKIGRAMRCNCYTDHGNEIGCASSWYPDPDYQSNIAGFRVARTLKAE